MWWIILIVSYVVTFAALCWRYAGPNSNAANDEERILNCIGCAFGAVAWPFVWVAAVVLAIAHGKLGKVHVKSLLTKRSK